MGHDELLAAPGHVVADRTGCCCNFSRSVVAARDVAAWVTEKSTCCGGGYSCCPASARVEVHPTGDRAGVVHVAVEARDADLAGPLNAAMRATLNADRSTPIIVNDGGKSFAASTCVCCVFQASNKLSLGGAGAYDLTAVHVQTGCFAMHQRLEGSSVADVAYAQYTNSIGACACVQSHLGGCHCGEQLVLGLKNHHTLLTVTTNKGQAKEAVTDMFRRTRHPMMPEPAVVRVVKGSTVCCGPESELSIGTEALTLSLFRFPTGCFCFAPCQAASNTSVPLDDVTLVGVMEESPCENASRAAASIPAHFGAMLSAVLYLNIIGFMLNLLNFVIGFPLILYESVAGLVCLPCRRSFVTVVGPADIAFRVRPPLDTGRSISDFAVELHQQIRELQTARRDMLAAILAGAGKDAVLFAAAPRAVDPTALPP